MRRTLALQREVLAELTTDELAAVAGAAASVLDGCAVSVKNLCNVPTCGNTCTNTSTVYKG